MNHYIVTWRADGEISLNAVNETDAADVVHDILAETLECEQLRGLAVRIVKMENLG